MPQKRTRDVTWAALFAALIAGGALVTIPLGPVPFTLQLLFVLMAGMILGSRLAALSILAYLVLGLVAPVYAGGASGVATLLGPSGGFLLGFVPGAALTGFIAGGGPRSPLRLIAAGIAGLAPVYLIGAAWLAAQLHLTMGASLAAGVLPFAWLDVVKAVVAGLATQSLVSLPLSLPALRSSR